MTVRTRLLLTIGAIILLLSLPSFYGIVQLRNLREVAEDLEQVHATDILALGNMRAALAELDRLQRSYVAAPDDAFRQGIHTQLLLARTNLSMLGGSGFEGEVREPARLLDTLAAATERLEGLVGAGRMQEATAYFEDVKPLIDSARSALSPLASALDDRGRAAVAEAQELSSAATRTTMLVVIIALLATLALGLWTTDALSRPLRNLSTATATVADGEFETPAGLPYDRADEIGHLSRAFRGMTERLAELDRLKAEFVSLATHELKTPINVISGYAELLEEGLYGKVEEKQREILGVIQEQTRSLTRLVNQLLDLSRFEAGGLRMEPEPVEIAELLSAVEGSFRALATQKRVEFEVEADASLPETAVLDQDRIRHEVLGNLLSNAFKFTATGGAVRLKAWSADGRIHMDVSDTGVGIPADQLAHIFEKYYQVGPEAKAQGSGLGLAIAKHVVEAHAGEITATSSVGRGTAFHIALPQEGPQA